MKTRTLCRAAREKWIGQSDFEYAAIQNVDGNMFEIAYLEVPRGRGTHLTGSTAVLPPRAECTGGPNTTVA